MKYRYILLFLLNSSMAFAQGKGASRCFVENYFPQLLYSYSSIEEVYTDGEGHYSPVFPDFGDVYSAQGIKSLESWEAYIRADSLRGLEDIYGHNGVVYSVLDSNTIFGLFKSGLLFHSHDDFYWQSYCLFAYDIGQDLLFCRYAPVDRFLSNFKENDNYYIIYVLKQRKCIGRIVFHNQMDLCADSKEFSILQVTQIYENGLEVLYWLDLKDLGLTTKETGRVMTRKIVFLEQLYNMISQGDKLLNFSSTKEISRQDKIAISYTEYIFSAGFH